MEGQKERALEHFEHMKQITVKEKDEDHKKQKEKRGEKISSKRERERRRGREKRDARCFMGLPPE